MKPPTKSEIRKKAARRRMSLESHGHIHTHRWRGSEEARESALARVVEDIGALVCGYPNVTDLYYCIEGTSVGVVVIAQKPMTRPIQELLNGFSQKLSETLPEISWNLSASPLPPPSGSNFCKTNLTLQ